ncbi:MAG: family 10 glycosylhydrolase [Prevotella sp.]|nr:family 10 glycosylhydrolase [Prevotella sp.]
MKRQILLFLFLLSVLVVAGKQKRAFRGAWIQCVNGQFQGLGRDAMQQTLSRQLDELQKDGVNAIFFQVRAECDALYPSPYEPWSKFLTGRQGLAPEPYWDPLQWMITACHHRGMELHAWINPYRAKHGSTTEMAATHIALRHPGRVFAYGNQLILNPALQENRDYICRIVDDIVTRYDVDGIHIDDYFYPYPVAGQTIPDAALYAARPEGCKTIGDWRRHQVSLAIRQLSDSIHQRKPWVKFGVSPFGIWRNSTSDPRGSATHGLQNYDDLYADVLQWVDEGWVDYCVPQLYWPIGHKAADYETLIRWWDRHVQNRPLYIGEDVERTVKSADLRNPSVNQMGEKYRLHDLLPNVQGTVLWYAKVVADNYGNYGHALRDYYWRYPALQPRMPWLDNEAPKAVRKMKRLMMSDGPVLFWTAPKAKTPLDEATHFAVYRFAKGEKVDLSDPSHLLRVTYDNFFRLPATKEKATYVVTSLDRVGNEGKGKKCKW